MRQALTLGLAGLLVIAPTLRGQVRIAIPLRPIAMDSTLRMATFPQARTGEVRVSKVGRIVTFALVGAVIGGALGYYSYKSPSGTPCTGSMCDEAREPRMLKGALIGGSVGLTLGVVSTLGAGGAKPVMR